eukprot:1269426-Pyramimonas_sp.AAC.1
MANLSKYLSKYLGAFLRPSAEDETANTRWLPLHGIRRQPWLNRLCDLLPSFLVGYATGASKNGRQIRRIIYGLHTHCHCPRVRSGSRSCFTFTAG